MAGQWRQVVVEPSPDRGHELLAFSRASLPLPVEIAIGLGDILLQGREDRRRIFDPVRIAQEKSFAAAMTVAVQKRMQFGKKRAPLNGVLERAGDLGRIALGERSMYVGARTGATA